MRCNVRPGEIGLTSHVDPNRSNAKLISFIPSKRGNPIPVLAAFQTYCAAGESKNSRMDFEV